MVCKLADFIPSDDSNCNEGHRAGGISFLKDSFHDSGWNSFDHPKMRIQKGRLVLCPFHVKPGTYVSVLVLMEWAALYPVYGLICSWPCRGDKGRKELLWKLEINQILFDLKDEIAEKIEIALDEYKQHKQDYMMQVIRYVNENFSWDKIAKESIEQISRVIS